MPGVWLLMAPDTWWETVRTMTSPGNDAAHRVASRFSIELLARTTLRCDGEPVVLEARAMHVLAALVLTRTQSISRAGLVTWIWGHSTADRSQLRNLLSDLRVAFGPESWRLAPRSTVLDLRGMHVDVVELAELAAAVRLDHDVDVLTLRRLLPAGAPTLLPDLPSTPDAQRAREQTLLDAKLIATSIARRGAAPSSALRSVLADLGALLPDDPQVASALTTTLLAAGDHDEALRVVRTYKAAALQRGRTLDDRLDLLEWKILSNSPDLMRRNELGGIDVAELDGSVERRRPSDGSIAQPAEPVPFVGRAAELRTLDAIAVGGRSVALIGEAGIGKSVLLGQWRARHPELDVVRTLCSAGDEPFGALRRAWPRLRIQAGTALEVVFDMIVRELDAGRRILAIDDFHWADASTRHVVALLSRTLPPNVDLIIATRPVAPNELAPIHLTKRIELTPFNSAELSRLAATSRVPWREIDVARLENLSSGLPLLAVELIHRFETDGPDALLLSADHGKIAENLTEQLLDAVSSGTREFLLVAALLGSNVDVDAASKVLNTQPALVTDLIDEARRARLLDVGPPLRFRHELVRVAIVQSLPPGRAAKLHHACARALDGRHPWVSAEHLLLASDVVDRAEIRAKVLDAAQQAEDAHHNDAAAELYRGLLELLERARVLDPADLVALSVAAARCYERAGHPDRGVAHRLTAMVEAERVGNVGWAIDAVRSGPGQGRSTAFDRVRVQLLRRALLLIEEQGRLDDPALRAAVIELRAELVVTEVLGGSPETPERRASFEALHVVAADPSQPDELRAIAARAVSCSELASIGVERRAEMSEILFATTSDDIDDIDLRSDAHALRLRSLLERGEIDEFDRVIASVHIFCSRSSRPVEIWGVQMAQSCAAEMRGDIDAAWTNAREALRHGRKYAVSDTEISWQTQQVSWARQGFAVPADDVGAPAVIDDTTGSNDEVAPHPAITDALGIAVSSMFGKPVEIDTLRRVASALAAPIGHLTWIPALVLLADVVADAGDRVAARSLLAAFGDAGNIFVIAGLTPVTCFGPMLASVGRLHATVGNLDLARTSFEQARELCVRAGATRWRRLVDAELARVDVAVGSLQAAPAPRGLPSTRAVPTRRRR